MGGKVGTGVNVESGGSVGTRVGVWLNAAIVVSVPGTHPVGLAGAMAWAVSVPAPHPVGLASSAARAVSVPATYGVKVSEGAGLDVETIVGCPEQAIRLNKKTRNRKDFLTLGIASLLMWR
jgi:hypothetical protein